MTPRLDYSRQAEAYANGRSLDAQNLTRWRTAIAALCHIDGAIITDVGSGTGISTRAWSDWGARLSVGCEPSAASKRDDRVYYPEPLSSPGGQKNCPLRPR